MDDEGREMKPSKRKDFFYLCVSQSTDWPDLQ